MKNYLIILVLLFTFTACNKNDSPKPEGIVGTWELRLYTTGWSMPKNYGAGNGNKFVFNTNGTYTKYAQNKIESRGEYVLTPTGEDNGTEFGKITLTDPDYNDVYSIRNDTFTIGTSIADGPSWQYIRIK